YVPVPVSFIEGGAMAYLLPAEYVQYGLTAETADDWVTMASALMESYCRRPSLMVTQYIERMRLTAGAQTVRLSYRPLASAAGAASALVSIRVRYGQPRRGELPDPYREQIAWAFSVPGSWNTLDVASVDVNEATAELTFPLNFLGLNYNEVEVTYTSGLVTVPDAVKVACVQIVKNAQATPAMNVKSSRMYTMQMQYFSSSLIDAQVQALLRPYMAERLG
ncbi:MAG: hypothetical protein ABI142_11045, partial [Bryocella sp.]